jgi:uncharacterized protein YigA (DUF484 family)
MADTSPIRSLLAQRSTDELDAMRDQTQRRLDQTQAELDLIEEVLADKKPKRAPRASRGDTKRRILNFIANSSEPVGPAQVRDELNETGPEIGSSAIYNMIRRLHLAGDLEKVGDGLYQLAARNGDRAEQTSPEAGGTATGEDREIRDQHGSSHGVR